MNILLITPGVFGLFSVLIIYFIAIPVIVWYMMINMIKLAIEKISEERNR